MGGRSVVIVGAGQAGSDAAAALRASGFPGRVVLVGDEEAAPYQRPPLSKAYPMGTVDAAGVELRPASFYTSHDIELVRGDRVIAVSRRWRTAALASGRELTYERLVLAVGARPRRLPVPGAELTGVLALRGLPDADALRDGLRSARHLLVVGAGFVGLEVAATARRMGIDVTVVEAGPRVMARALTPVMSGHLAEAHRAQGVRLLLSRELSSLHGDSAGRVRVARLNGGERIPADLVVMGVGVLPRTELAADAGLTVGDGVLVDELLRTSDHTIHAIGDCARFPSPYAAGHLRLESVQNASDQARHVASVICGGTNPYRAVPWFWTEQYDLRVQIAGITGGHDRTVVTGDTAEDRFTVFCFRGDRLVGAESVNRPADHMITRRLLAAGGLGLTPDEASRPGFDIKAHQRARQPA